MRPPSAPSGRRFSPRRVRASHALVLSGLLIMMHHVVKGEQRRAKMGRSMRAAARICCGEHMLTREAIRDWQLSTVVSARLRRYGALWTPLCRRMCLFFHRLGTVQSMVISDFIHSLQPAPGRSPSPLYVPVLIIGLCWFTVTARNLYPINSICILPNMDISNWGCHW